MEYWCASVSICRCRAQRWSSKAAEVCALGKEREGRSKKKNEKKMIFCHQKISLRFLQTKIHLFFVFF